MLHKFYQESRWDPKNSIFTCSMSCVADYRSDLTAICSDTVEHADLSATLGIVMAAFMKLQEKTKDTAYASMFDGFDEFMEQVSSF